MALGNGNGLRNLADTNPYHISNPIFCKVYKEKVKDKTGVTIVTGSSRMIGLIFHS
jgi:hypothetical protein